MMMMICCACVWSIKFLKFYLEWLLHLKSSFSTENVLSVPVIYHIYSLLPLFHIAAGSTLITKLYSLLCQPSHTLNSVSTSIPTTLLMPFTTSSTKCQLHHPLHCCSNKPCSTHQSPNLAHIVIYLFTAPSNLPGLAVGFKSPPCVCTLQPQFNFYFAFSWFTLIISR